MNAPFFMFERRDDMVPSHQSITSCVLASEETSLAALGSSTMIRLPPSPVTFAPTDVTRRSPPSELMKRSFVFWSISRLYRSPQCRLYHGLSMSCRDLRLSRMASLSP